MSFESADSFYSSALREYIGTFEFTGDALDIALRKLLMDVGLPKETQQIDRVIEAFAARYIECNPGLFVSAGTYSDKQSFKFLIDPQITPIFSPLAS